MYHRNVMQYIERNTCSRFKLNYNEKLNGIILKSRLQLLKLLRSSYSFLENFGIPSKLYYFYCVLFLLLKKYHKFMKKIWKLFQTTSNWDLVLIKKRNIFTNANQETFLMELRNQLKILHSNITT